MAEENGIKRTVRGVLAIAAMVVFASLAHMIVHIELSEGIIGVVGGALAISGDWVKTAFNFFFGKQQSDSEKP